MRESTLEDYKKRMLRVLVHIQQNLDEALSLEELAGIAYFSPYHFHRIFRGMLGESVKGHIRRLRLERAATRLKHGNIPVTHIAFEVESVPAMREQVLARGGSEVGEVVTLTTPDGRRVEWCYVADPEGNVIELQTWNPA